MRFPTVIAYLVLLDDVTQNRATAVSVQRFDSVDIALDCAEGDYDVVTDATLVPSKGERVWIERACRSSGRRPITARGGDEPLESRGARLGDPELDTEDAS